MKNGILIGCHQGLSNNDIKYIQINYYKIFNNANIRNFNLNFLIICYFLSAFLHLIESFI